MATNEFLWFGDSIVLLYQSIPGLSAKVSINKSLLIISKEEKENLKNTFILKQGIGH